MYEFRFDYVKPKFDEKPKLCDIDTGIFIIYIKTYEDIVDRLQKKKQNNITQISHKFLIIHIEY